MRQLVFAAALGLIGVILAGILVRIVGAGSTSISENWLTAGAVLPVFGVVVGVVLAHRLSGGADPWPITAFSRRIPFAVLGGVLGALTWYGCYVMLAAMWNDQSILTLLLDPSSIPGLSSAGHDGMSFDAPVSLYVVIGLVAGAFVTDSAIRRKWTS
jgi:hypothetical protein